MDKKAYTRLLTKLDPMAVWRYQISVEDLIHIERYIRHLQGSHQVASTWELILTAPSPYATSLVIHELMECRFLAGNGIVVTDQTATQLRTNLAANWDVHLRAVYEEHYYLQDYIYRTYMTQFELLTLLAGNRYDTADLDLFLSYEIGLFKFNPDRVTAARQLLERIKMDQLRYRKLQRLTEDNAWVDEGFAYEDETGATVFCYNVLIWGSTGSRLNQRIQQARTPLEKIETIVQTGERQRWLPAKTANGAFEETKVNLAKDCGLPWPRRGARVIITGTNKTPLAAVEQEAKEG